MFHEITKSAVEEAFANTRELDLYLVDAYQARVMLDKIIGYKGSSVLWKKVKSKISAGRVQSVAVRLLVEREREVRVFVPEEYWEVYADTECEQQELRLQVVKENGENFRPACKDETDTALAS